jgi:hypothetical protein
LLSAILGRVTSPDPRVKALLKLGIGRFGGVNTPGFARVLATMSDRAHAGFQGQRAFVACRRQGAIARAGRGGGKSTAMLARFHAPSSSHPGCSSVFVAMSSERARDILYPATIKANKDWGTQIEYRSGDNAFVWPNGYRVLARGCKDLNEVNKRRGTPWVAAGWDECASIGSKLLEEDIHEAVAPRLMDFNGLWFAGGTPGPVPQGYWYDLSGGEGGTYPIFSWDSRHNSHMPNALRYFSETLQRMQGIPDRTTWPSHCETLIDLINDPECWKLLPNGFVREYLGQWVLDLKALIYKLTPKNSFAEFPIEPDYWTIGLDLGSHSEEEPHLDHAAVAVCASSRQLPYIWCRESRKLSDCTVDSLAAVCSQLCERYPKATVHIDGASAGKLIERTLQRMGLPIQCAEKAHKLRRIQLVQSAIRNGNLQLHIRDCMDARHEAVSLVWNDKRNDHSERCDDDAWDALLYAASPHFGDYRPEENPIERGSKEWQQAQEMAEYEEALAEAIEEHGAED